MERGLTRRDQKRALRRRILAAREAQAAKAGLSARICTHLTALPEHGRARTILWYLDCRSELRTRETVARELEGPRTIAIPYVSGSDLRLWRLAGMDELEPGRFGILEPARGLRERTERHLDPRHVDLVVVPGVAFDPYGNRLGSGFGYYDRLLARMRPDTHLVAPCFQSQVVESVPAEPHDIRVHRVLTEMHSYPEDPHHI